MYIHHQFEVMADDDWTPREKAAHPSLLWSATKIYQLDMRRR
jgi:hypothetical protein